VIETGCIDTFLKLFSGSKLSAAGNLRDRVQGKALSLKGGNQVMTSRQTEVGIRAVEVLTDFARATGQDFPVISNQAQQLALDIGLWLRNNPGQPNND